jgi:nicotinate-nucleotide adenylyltransferase
MIGVFGGTFDPPHLGHLILADEGRSTLNLEGVLWTPVGEPPHKPDREITPPHLRVMMVQAAISGDPNFHLSLVDLDRPGPHYTIDGLALIKQQVGGKPIAYLMGSDSLADLPQWHSPAAVIQECAILGILRRAGSEPDLELLERELPGVSAKVVYFDAPRVGISGDEIRRRVGEGRSYRYLVLPRVADIIEADGLYR